jgi:thymidine phosphorylase
MVQLGDAHGVKTSALITNMDVPLGRTAGNALEVEEAVAALEGKGPDDLVEVTIALAEEMLALAGTSADARAVLSDGAALDRWRTMVSAQGGNPDAPLPQASERRSFDARESGYVSRLDARSVGIAAWRLGAGRARKEDPVNAAAGVVCTKKPGDEVEAGEPILELHGDDPSRFEAASAALEGAVEIAREPPEPSVLVIDRIRP